MLCVAGFHGVAGNGFVSFDDPQYITQNPAVLHGLSAEGLSWAFGTTRASNWHPLTWLSHMLDAELFGARPRGHHLVGLALHAVNTALLFLVLAAMTGALWPPAFAAALFGIHPLHVESVAWAAERKDLLCALFWLLGLAAHLRHARAPGAARAATTVAAFGLGLLSKPMIVTFPLTLLVLDWWPLGRSRGDGPAARRWARLVAEKALLLALASIAGALTFAIQWHDGALMPLEELGAGARLSNAAVSYVRYLRLTFWPSGLAPFYPHPERAWPPLPTLAAAALLAVVTVVVLAARGRRPWLAAGWAWFLVTLFPVIGLVQAGIQAQAGRYTYVPLIGVFVAVPWTVTLWARGSGARRRLAAAAVAAALATLTILTVQQVATWRDDVALATRMVEVLPTDWRSRHTLSRALLGANRVPEAAGELARVLEVRPDSVETRVLLGIALERLGRLDEALAAFEEASRDAPGHDWARRGVARVLLAQGRSGEAHALLEDLARHQPAPLLLRDLAIIRAGAGDDQGALAALQAATALAPRDADVRYDLGLALDRLGRGREAEAAYRETLRLDPFSALAHNNLGALLATGGRREEARGHFVAALRLDPGFVEARANLERLGVSSR